MGNSASEIPNAAHRAALEWQVIFWSGEVTAAEQEAFRQWLAAAPAHERAWRDVHRLDHMIAGVPGRVGGQLLRLPELRSGRRTLLRTLGWATAGGIVSLAVRETPQWQSASAAYKTRTGEHRDIVLNDGTRVSLNTATAMDVRFDREQRRIVLYDGEILVDTAPDPTFPKRPFFVHTKHGLLQALGTRFVVRREERTTQVAVFEGAVEIESQDMPSRRLRIAAGQKSSFDSNSIDAVHPADPLDVAWTRGLFVADRMRLADFLLRLSRHRPGILRCEARIAGLPVSGVYPLEDTDRILATLAEALPVRIDYATRYWVTVRAR